MLSKTFILAIAATGLMAGAAFAQDSSSSSYPNKATTPPDQIQNSPFSPNAVNPTPATNNITPAADRRAIQCVGHRAVTPRRPGRLDRQQYAGDQWPGARHPRKSRQVRRPAKPCGQVDAPRRELVPPRTDAFASSRSFPQRGLKQKSAGPMVRRLFCSLSRGFYWQPTNPCRFRI